MVASRSYLPIRVYSLAFLSFMFVLSAATSALPNSNGTQPLVFRITLASQEPENTQSQPDELVFPSFLSADLSDGIASRRAEATGGKLTFASLRNPAPAQERPNEIARKITDKAFPNWTRVMRLHGYELSTLERYCVPGAERSCPLAGWMEFLESIKHEDRRTQITLVNDFANRFHYRSDSSNWDKIDYWASPTEFFAVGGDCEDFAIAKFFSLKLLGVSPDDMRIVVLQDQRRRTNHAVLTVEHESETLMLDSVEPEIMSWREASHYRPFFSVNERHYWLHTTG